MHEKEAVVIFGALNFLASLEPLTRATNSRCKTSLRSVQIHASHELLITAYVIGDVYLTA